MLRMYDVRCTIYKAMVIRVQINFVEEALYF
jgi:hypothetical protein